MMRRRFFFHKLVGNFNTTSVALGLVQTLSTVTETRSSITFKEEEIKSQLDIDPEARPIKQKLRPVAIHLQVSVKRELDKQVEEGIHDKVDSIMGPTPWISNQVVVPIGGKKHENNPPDLFDIRLTCDARPMNKAL
ncbi:hypothetical protein BpHYR1_033444 [Brachionus plicatilis]|uniref:Uncharacterized protein n=1 Tax=Brachionus plicatilis TaxID=10195 RepID=A0A3M7PG57_BRAPC|nr:hypothetical protein BpHYR1_033444 [Brachionus plicatilis]